VCLHVYAYAEELAHTSMHRAGHVIYLLVFASIKGCELSVYSVYFRVSRAAKFCAYEELSMYLNWLACIQSSVGIIICFHVLRAFACVCMCMHPPKT
jgi:hypothetical protein